VDEIECVVAAAGGSVRMGEWKPLLPFRESTIIQAVVAEALAACARVILVTGFRGEELERLFAAEPRVLVVRNPAWETGMFCSQQQGIAQVRSDRFFIMPGDMPLVPADVYRALLAGVPAEAVFPVFQGMRGHPVLFSRRVGDAALREDPGTGRMRDIARRFDCRDVQWTDGTILRDIDTKDDYREITQ
jgi:molybdenum cofactor cytidylyltransferase